MVIIIARLIEHRNTLLNNQNNRLRYKFGGLAQIY